VAVETAIAFQSLQPAFSFLGNDTSGKLSLTFGTTTVSDYVPLPKTLSTDFAPVGAALNAAPPPVGGPTLGTELVTNIILLNLNYIPFSPNAVAKINVHIWNWFEFQFKSTHQFICWERIPLTTIDPRAMATDPLFNANYGNIRFTPNPLAPTPSDASPAILGSIEGVSTSGRTLRNLIHSGAAASPATFIEFSDFH